MEEICREFLSDQEPTIISHITTDGDSTAFRGAEKAMAEQGHVVEALRDTRHLAQSQKKAADNAKFSGTNTPKSEAIHRGYSKSNPKNVTCARNFQPQIFSAIHRLNHGPRKSAAIKCAALGGPVTDGTRVSRQLQRKQRKNEQDRLRKRSSKYRARRQTLVKQKFQMYFQRAETQIQAGYSKGMSNPPPYLIPRRPENILTVKSRK